VVGHRDEWLADADRDRVVVQYGPALQALVDPADG